MPEDGRISAARYDGEPDTKGDFTDEFAAVAYDTIARRLEGMVTARVFEDGIMLDDPELTLSCAIQRIGEANGNYSAEMLFIISHSLFDEPLCEYTAGIGNSAEEAIINGTEQFTVTVLLSVLSAFGCTGGSTLTSEFGGRERTFKRSCESVTYTIGRPVDSSHDMFELIEEKLPDYLGSKKAYWIKLYAVCYDGNVTCEVRLNGAVMQDLSDELLRYADKWEDKQAFHSEKQFILLLDTDPVPEREYIPAEAVISLTKQAIGLFGTVTDDKSDRLAVEKLKRLCGKNPDLAFELRALIPELYTCELLGLRQGDGIKLRIGDAVLSLKRSQLRNFGYIEQGITQFLSEDSPDSGSSLNIMYLSSLFEAVNSAVNNGAELDDVFVADLQLAVPDDYELL